MRGRSVRGTDVVAVAVGGVIGTGLRLSIDALLPHESAAFPWSTFIANLTGAFVLGWLVGGLWKLPRMPHWVRAGMGSGVLGSYTTFSSLMVSLVAIGSTGDWPLALLYLTASILIGFALAAAGLRLGSSEAHRRMPRGIDDAGETL
jgi:CrcB protein